jgi:hypothetical protein
MYGNMYIYYYSLIYKVREILISTAKREIALIIEKSVTTEISRKNIVL